MKISPAALAAILFVLFAAIALTTNTDNFIAEVRMQEKEKGGPESFFAKHGIDSLSSY